MKNDTKKLYLSYNQPSSNFVNKIKIKFSFNKIKNNRKLNQYYFKNKIFKNLKRKILKVKNYNNLNIIDISFKDKSNNKELNTLILDENKVYNSSKLIKNSIKINEDYDNDSDDSIIKIAVKNNIKLINK